MLSKFERSVIYCCRISKLQISDHPRFIDSANSVNFKRTSWTRCWSQFACFRRGVKNSPDHPRIPRRADRFIGLCKLAWNDQTTWKRGSGSPCVPQFREIVGTSSDARGCEPRWLAGLLSRESAIKMAVTSLRARPCAKRWGERQATGCLSI